MKMEQLRRLRLLLLLVVVVILLAVAVIARVEGSCDESIWATASQICSSLSDLDFGFLRSEGIEETLAAVAASASTRKGGFPVRLGKFRKLDETEGVVAIGETSSSKLDARRCYSLGSYQYVVGDAKLRVGVSRERARNREKLVKGNEELVNAPVDETENTDGKKISIGIKTDSYSVSKIWLWSKKGKFASSSGAQLENLSPPTSIYHGCTETKAFEKVLGYHRSLRVPPAMRRHEQRWWLPVPHPLILSSLPPWTKAATPATAPSSSIYV